MYRKHPSLLTAVLLALGTFLAAVQSADEKAAVDALIAKLSSPDAAERAGAQEQLINMGDEARVALEAFIKTRTSAEATLQRIKAGKSATATPVSVEFKDVRPQAAFAELSRQTMVDFHAYGEEMWQQANLNTVNLKAERQPFWSVVRELCQQSGLTIYNSGSGERKLTLAPLREVGGNLMKHPAVVDAAFMVVVGQLSRTSTVDLASPDSIRRTLNLSLQVLVEPKTNVVAYARTAEMDEIVDDKGNSLLPANPAGASRGSMGASRGLFLSVAVPATYPEQAGQRIARMKGRIPIRVQTQSQVVQVPKVLQAKDVTEPLGSRRMTLKGVTRVSDRHFNVNLVFSRDPNDDGSESYTPSYRLVDEAGQPYSFGGSEGVGGGEVRLSFSKRDGSSLGEPATFIAEITTATQDMNINFEFNDLPLP